MERSVRELMVDVVDRVADRLSQMTTEEVNSEVGLPTDLRAGAFLGDAKDDDEDWTCAICLDVPQHSDRCSIVGCGHQYCVTCVVHWASSRPNAARCPTCKTAFSLISLNKNLDGTLAEHPVQETVAMVARSRWFRAWLTHRDRIKDKGQRIEDAIQHMGPRSTYSLMQEEWAEDELYSYFEQEFEEDDVEEYYVGRTNGHRNAFGNRPFGPNGYMRAGRKLAAVPKRPKGKQPGAGCASASRPANQQTQKAAPQGRRAQRKAKRAVAE